MNILTDIQNVFLPELILIITILINIIVSLFLNTNTYKLAKIITLSALFICVGFLYLNKSETSYYTFNDMFISNIFTSIFKTITIISGSLIILCSKNLIREKRNKSFEYFVIFLTGILGAFCLISASDFLSAFIAIELLGISCYFLSGYRKNHKSKEAALKYLITGASASTILLLGISYLYGISGSTNFAIISNSFIQNGINLFYIGACLLILFGSLFKLGCIPFSNWVIDVYEGSNYPTCLYLSLIPKIAAIAFLARLFVYIFSFSPIILILTAILSLITIVYASIGAIKQSNIKRLYAYSSIIHSGFLLLAISNLTVYSIATVIFYLITYIFMNAGIWCASIIYSTDFQTDNIEDYKGLFKKHPYFTIALSICLIGLAGLPPSSGFLAKIFLFSAIARGNFIWLTILLFTMLTTIIAMFAYFKVIRELFAKKTNNITLNKQNLFAKIMLYICAFITIIICITPDLFIKISQIASYYI